MSVPQTVHNADGGLFVLVGYGCSVQRDRLEGCVAGPRAGTRSGRRGVGIVAVWAVRAHMRRVVASTAGHGGSWRSGRGRSIHGHPFVSLISRGITTRAPADTGCTSTRRSSARSFGV